MSRSTTGWVLVALQFVLLAAIVLLPWRSPTLLSLAIGVPLMAAGIVLGLVSGRQLGRALTPTPVPIEGAGLRTDGPYRWVRHPIYSAILLAAAGFVVAVGSAWTVLAALALLGLLWGKSRWEDSLLHHDYGQQWQEWASRTGALVPRPKRP